MDAKVCFLLFFVICLNFSFYNFAPVTSDDVETSTESNENANDTELYVIREVVYEVGILTEDNSTLNDEESFEQVELKFFDPDHNKSFIDLSNIPLPVQTNVSGHVITGVAPVSLGSLKLPILNGTDPVLQPENGAAAYPLPNALISVTTNLTTTNPQTGSEILQGLPPLLGLTQHSNADNSNST